MIGFQNKQLSITNKFIFLFHSLLLQYLMGILVRKQKGYFKKSAWIDQLKTQPKILLYLVMLNRVNILSFSVAAIQGISIKDYRLRYLPTSIFQLISMGSSKFLWLSSMGKGTRILKILFSEHVICVVANILHDSFFVETPCSNALT